MKDFLVSCRREVNRVCRLSNREEPCTRSNRELPINDELWLARDQMALTLAAKLFSLCCSEFTHDEGLKLLRESTGCWIDDTGDIADDEEAGTMAELIADQDQDLVNESLQEAGDDQLLADELAEGPNRLLQCVASLI